MKNIFNITMELALIVEGGADPSTMTPEDMAKKGTLLSLTVARYGIVDGIIEQPPAVVQPEVVEQAEPDNTVYCKWAKKKIKRKRNRQRLNWQGELVHEYRSGEYVNAAIKLRVGKLSNRGKKRIVWLNKDERYLVSEYVKEQKGKRKEMK